MFVLSTLGHVDHGKSSFLAALTGMKVDRLAEEQKRGMTIDLGFVSFPSERGPVGIVDVPGHKKFTRNLVCGVSPIDGFILVVAADDGPMPQTFEHLRIAQTLGIRQGIVVVSKVDRVESGHLAEVEAEIQQALKPFPPTPVLPFSAPTHQGLTEIRTALSGLLTQLPAPEARKGFRLWVDRSFHPQGQGTVLTGTLREGPLHSGQEIFLWPLATIRRLKTAQAYHKAVESAVPNTRLAIGVSGVGREQVGRGTLASFEAPFLAACIDASLSFFCAPPNRNLRCTLHIGSLEEPCAVIPLETKADSAFRIRFQRPIPIRFGDRFLIRSTSGEKILGGGLVVNPFQPRTKHQVAVERMAQFENSPSGLISLAENSRLVVDSSLLAKASHFSLEELERALGKSPTFAPLGKNQWASKNWIALLQQFGMRKTLGEIKNWALKHVPAASDLPELLAAGEELGLWRIQAGGMAPPETGAKKALSANEKRVVDYLENSESPISLAVLLEAGLDRNAIFSATKSQAIVALADQHFFSSDRYTYFQQKVREKLQAKSPATTSELKETLGKASRKHAVLILERMDSDRLTYLKDGVRFLLR